MIDLQKDIKKLEENYAEMELFEVEIKLIEIEKQIVEIINAEGFGVRKPFEELKSQVKYLKDNIYDLGKEDLAGSFSRIRDKIGDAVDINMMSGIGAAGEYLYNLRNGIKPNKNKNK